MRLDQSAGFGSSSNRRETRRAILAEQSARIHLDLHVSGVHVATSGARAMRRVRDAHRLVVVECRDWS